MTGITIPPSLLGSVSNDPYISQLLTGSNDFSTLSNYGAPPGNTGVGTGIQYGVGSNSPYDINNILTGAGSEQGSLPWYKNPDSLAGIGAIGTAGANLFGAFNSYQLGKLAEEQFAFQKDAFNKNFDYNKEITEERRGHRNRAIARHTS